MKVKECFNRFKAIDKDLKELIEVSDFDNYEDLSGLEIDFSDPDDLLIWHKLESIIWKIDDIHREIEYLSRPIKGEYTLEMNDRGRYECEIKEFSSGNTIEYLFYDEEHDRYEWKISRVEYSGYEYYIVGDGDTKLDGLKIRIR